MLFPSLAAGAGIALSLLIACGSADREFAAGQEQTGEGECAGQHLGKWTGVALNDSVTYAADCSYTYRGPDGCTEKGTYARALVGTGPIQVTVTESTGGDCFPEGTYTCEYTLSEDTLTSDCGDGSYVYRRD